jgi:ketosteroid isomerase-like protein
VLAYCERVRCLRREPEAIEVLGDQVIATVRVHARFKGSGIVLDERCADVRTVRDGKVQRLEVFTDPAQALTAFGVGHQP